jgi:hypothetical protein
VFWDAEPGSVELEAEYDRMVASTNDPDGLDALIDALGGDSEAVGEALIRPVYVERRIHELFSTDASIHGAARSQIEAIRSAVLSGGSMREAGGEFYRCYTYQALPAGAPESLFDEAGTMLGDCLSFRLPESDFNAKTAGLGAQREISSIEESEEFFRFTRVAVRTPMHVRVESIDVPKTSFDEWWEGGARDFVVGDPDFFPEPIKPAGILLIKRLIPCRPSTQGEWRPLAATALSARWLHTAVWTGAEMVIWGGYVSSYFNDGGRYYPADDAWLSVSTLGSGPPAARAWHTAVWTGAEMIVWGGSYCVSETEPCVLLNDTWAYVPQPREDVNRDGMVDFRDLNIVRMNLGRLSTSPLYDPRADVNADGRADKADYLLVQAKLGQRACPAEKTSSSTSTGPFFPLWPSGR